MDILRIIARLRLDEGFQEVAYWDRDQWTYGYGTKAPGKGATISVQEAQAALRERVEQAMTEYGDLFGHLNLDEVRAEALTNMLFNLGLTKFAKFTKMVKAINMRDWGHTAYEAFNSKWFRQLRKKGLKSIERSERIVWELLTGERG